MISCSPLSLLLIMKTVGYIPNLSNWYAKWRLYLFQSSWLRMLSRQSLTRSLMIFARSSVFMIRLFRTGAVWREVPFSIAKVLRFVPAYTVKSLSMSELMITPVVGVASWLLRRSLYASLISRNARWISHDSIVSNHSAIWAGVADRMSIVIVSLFWPGNRYSAMNVGLVSLTEEVSRRSSRLAIGPFGAWLKLIKNQSKRS